LHIPHTLLRCDNKTVRLRLFAATTSLLLLTACGYHTVGAASHLPAGVRTIAVPAFTTRAQAFHTEFAFTQAVIRELNTRTKYQVIPTSGDKAPDADATLRGVILSQSASPLTYDSTSGQTSSYLITITARVTLTARDGHVLYQNDALPFREQYQSTQDTTSFIQEDSPAVQRIARDFAQAVIAAILESY
jgi:outer membrane lipopolysaccharide assembly protein LptE/RlpB